jgi:aspartate ammonia-lyase
MTFRTERDPLGELNVPADAYYGVQTARAVENFRISELRAPSDLVTATILIKKAAAETNRDLGRLDPAVANAIVSAADEILSGRLREQFVVDAYQAGAGTSHNMNANEVLANRAGELLGEARGTYQRIHPNDHVNMGQSTNDVFPAATRLALLLSHGRLIDSARSLADALQRKADAFAGIIKTGRTHLQDAVPLTLGQEFGGYASCISSGADHVDQACAGLLELNIGATAVGTGLNAGEDYRRAAIEYLRQYTGLGLKIADNLFRVTQSMGDVLAYSSAMRRLAVELSKVANDLRLLSMGPRAGLSEIVLPAVQPGSSIMPGKVNPSVPEMVNQVCFQVIGCDTTVALACEAGQLELNVMMPVIAWNALHSSAILHRAMDALRTLTIEGLAADAARARELLDRSTAAATALSPYIGYVATADIAKESVKTGKSIRDLVLARGLLDEKQLDEILSIEAMTRGGLTGQAGGAGTAGKPGEAAKR